jgi:hypothetical protein
MDTTSRPRLGLIDGNRDQELVRIGATGTNAELAEVVARLKHRAALAVVAPSRPETASQDTHAPD